MLKNLFLHINEETLALSHLRKYHDRTPGLFKAKFQERRMITLTSKCYYAENSETKSMSYAKPKFSCEGVSKKQNPMSWERYLKLLDGSINIAMNMGFHLFYQEVVTYTQDKLDLNMYYSKCIIDPNGIHTELLR